MKSPIQLIEEIIRAKMALHLRLVAHRKAAAEVMASAEADTEAKPQKKTTPEGQLPDRRRSAFRESPKMVTIYHCNKRQNWLKSVAFSSLGNPRGNTRRRITCVNLSLDVKLSA